MRTIFSRLRRLADLSLLPVSGNTAFWLTMFVLCSISIISVEHGRCSRMRAGLELFADIYILSLVTLLFPARPARYLKLTIFSLFYVAAVADMLCYLIMGTAMIPSVLQTCLLTNKDEASEAVSGYFSPSLFRSPLTLLLLTPLLGWWLCRTGFRIRRNAGLAIVAITMVSAVYGISNKRYLYHVLIERSSDDDMKSFRNIDTMTRDYLPIYRFMLSAKEICRFSKMGERLLDNVRHTETDSCSYRSPLIVLIIGESYNRHHSSLYGYAKPTAPRQRKWLDRGNLYLFDNVIASWNLTYKSFQNMLSLYSYGMPGVWYDYPIIMSVFRKAGYEVDFFSNQNVMNNSGAFTDFIEDMFVNNPQLSPYLFDKRNENVHQLDIDLLGDYHRLCDSGSPKPQLLMFHFIGMHVDFSLRYPENRHPFSAADYRSRRDLTDEQRAVIADYDNAIAYNDFVVDSIVNTFAGREAVIIYVPDHGEMVYDDGRDFGRSLRLDARDVRNQYDIPFWILCTDTYKERHRDVCSLIEQAVHRPFMTDDLPHLLLYLAGIHCKAYSPERNLIDRRFDSGRIRLIRGEADYDKIVSSVK